MEDARRRAAEEPSANAPPAVRADHDQSRLATLGDTADLINSSAAAENRLHLEGALSCLPDSLAGHSLCPFPCKLDMRSGGHCTERSEEHTSELQSRENLVCRLL